MLASQVHAGPPFPRKHFDFPLRPNKPYDETNVTVSRSRILGLNLRFTADVSFNALAEK
jgi:hypothetical protein